jgi:site-specific recombinase XerD
MVLQFLTNRPSTLSCRATYVFESNRLTPFSTRRIQQFVHQYAAEGGIEKRVYLHFFRRQNIIYLTRKSIISPKLQLLSGHSEEKSLAIYRDLALTDIAADYKAAM